MWLNARRLDGMRAPWRVAGDPQCGMTSFRVGAGNNSQPAASGDDKTFANWPQGAPRTDIGPCERRVSLARTALRLIRSAAGRSLRREPIQAALVIVLEQPHRAVRRLLHVADAEADRPVLGWCRARAVHLDPVQGTADEAGREGRALPLREHFAAIEHQVAGREDGRPVDHRLGEVGSRVGARDGHAVVVHRVGAQRPAVVLARLDQVEFVAAARPVLQLPQPAIRRKRDAVGRAMA